MTPGRNTRVVAKSPQVAGNRIAWSLLGGVLVTALLVARPADSTHGMDHRYVVLGYVRDEDGRSLPHRPVQLVREKTGLAYRAETSAEGFYALIVHLHDEDVLDPLQLSASEVQIRIEARFNPLNPQRPRGTRVDFAGGQARERPEMFAPTLEEYLRR